MGSLPRVQSELILLFCTKFGRLLDMSCPFEAHFGKKKSGLLFVIFFCSFSSLSINLWADVAIFHICLLVVYII